MRKARAIVRENLTAEEAQRAALALVAMGLDAEIGQRRRPVPPASMRSVTDGGRGVFADSFASDAGTAFDANSGTHDDIGGEDHTEAEEPAVVAPRGDWAISVAVDEIPTALPLIAEALSAENQLRRAEPPATLLKQPPGGIWTLEHSAASILIAAVCMVVHASVHPAGEPVSRSRMIEAGAAAPWLISDGQWWRLLSAAFLHFDLKHLIGNTSALLFLGPPLATAVGQMRVLLLFVATALAGNVVSQLLGSEAAVKAGASGGVCGLLGALAGVAIAAMARATDARERRPAWQTLGALVALFGMIVGFEPGRDHYAHLGGLVAGVLLGRLLGPVTPATPATRATSATETVRAA